MNLNDSARASAAALLILASVLVPTRVAAAIADYSFQLVDESAKVGSDTIISVRLVDKRTGTLVPEAIIFATRLDMAPDGMGNMTSNVSPMPGASPGIYRFKATISMGGTWRLSLAAKVQGEDGTLDEKLVIKAGE